MTYIVIKNDHTGRETLRYEGERLAGGPGWVCVAARFAFSDRDLGYVVLRQGDRFTEWFYADRWYNIFRIEDVRTGLLKGWYCNFTRPALIGPHSVQADDLALDCFVYPDGHLLLLDEEEYAALPLTPTERAEVSAALDHLRAQISGRRSPFDDTTG